MHGIIEFNFNVKIGNIFRRKNQPKTLTVKNKNKIFQ